MREIKPHKLNIDFSNIPKQWFPLSSFGNDLLNTFNLLFPAAEKFFIRNLKNFDSKNFSPRLKSDLKGFIGQESMHANMHEKVFQVLRDQGYEIDSFLRFFEDRIIPSFENYLSKNLNLSITAGLEHFTAMLATIALEGDLFHDANSSMKDLYEWHAAEELEHKAVAYDILLSVDDSYLLRCIGMIVAALALFFISSSGVILFMKQDNRLLDFNSWRGIYEFFLGSKYNVAQKGIAEFIKYFDPKFHPNQKIDLVLINKVFDRLDKQIAA